MGGPPRSLTFSLVEKTTNPNKNQKPQGRFSLKNAENLRLVLRTKAFGCTSQKNHFEPEVLIGHRGWQGLPVALHGIPSGVCIRATARGRRRPEKDRRPQAFPVRTLSSPYVQWGDVGGPWR